jgi:hypothetical protein
MRLPTDVARYARAPVLFGYSEHERPELAAWLGLHALVIVTCTSAALQSLPLFVVGRDITDVADPVVQVESWAGGLTTRVIGTAAAIAVLCGVLMALAMGMAFLRRSQSEFARVSPRLLLTLAPCMSIATAAELGVIMAAGSSMSTLSFTAALVVSMAARVCVLVILPFRILRTHLRAGRLSAALLVCVVVVPGYYAVGAATLATTRMLMRPTTLFQEPQSGEVAPMSESQWATTLAQPRGPVRTATLKAAHAWHVMQSAHDRFQASRAAVDKGQSQVSLATTVSSYDEMIAALRSVLSQSGNDVSAQLFVGQRFALLGECHDSASLLRDLMVNDAAPPRVRLQAAVTLACAGVTSPEGEKLASVFSPLTEIQYGRLLLSEPLVIWSPAIDSSLGAC